MILTDFSENVFANNGSVSVELSADSVADLDTLSTYQGDYIEVRGGAISRKGQWNDLGLPYRVVDASIVVQQELVIAAGTEIVFEENLGIWVEGGSLRALDDDQDNLVSRLGGYPGLLGGNWSGR